MTQTPQTQTPAPHPETGIASLLHDRLQNLAVEMASELLTPKEILKRYGITAKEFKVIAATPKFKKDFQDAKIAWGSVSNAKERVALKAAMVSESALLRINQIIHDNDTPPSNVIEAHKHISNLGNLITDLSTLHPAPGVDQ